MNEQPIGEGKGRMNLILGAGVTGLSAGIKTGYPIYEASNHSGGICRSYNKDGFEFSTGGGHWLFGRGQGLDFIKTLVPLKEYERKAGVYYNHTFPYPFQTTASKELEELHGDWQPQTLKESLVTKFGKEQCNIFFHPFNEKYTAGLYDRVIQDEDYKSPPAGGKGFCSTFCDPVNGLSDLVDKMASKCEGINYNTKAIGIRANDKVLMIQDKDGVKHQVQYKKLISTIPLNKLLWLCGQQDEAKRLPYTSVLVINIGAEPDINTPEEHWLYIPFCGSGFYRVGFYSNVDSNNAPKGMVSLSVELAFLPGQDINIEEKTAQIITELQSWRWIGQVHVTDPTIVRCAYTWLYNREDRDNALAWLKEHDIYSIGRYGKWKFQGMTDSIKDGLELAL